MRSWKFLYKENLREEKLKTFSEFDFLLGLARVRM